MHKDKTNGACACGHDHSACAVDPDCAQAVNGRCAVCGHSLANCTCPMPDAEAKKQVYTLKNLDCAACAAKIEQKLSQMPAVHACSVSYATGQLRLAATHQNELLPEIERVVHSVEPDVEVIPVQKAGTRTATFAVDGLDCAACAAKIEDKIRTVPGVDDASLTYATGSLKITAKNPQALLPKIQKAADAVEDGVTIRPKTAAKPEAETEEDSENTKKELMFMLIGAAVFIGGWLLEGKISHTAELVTMLIAYLILGGQVLINAVKNIFKGNFFDENFLMALATVGAFLIGDYHEGVGVMLFYRVGEYFEDVAVDRSRSQIMQAVDMRPDSVNLIVGDKTETIPAAEAQIGDVLLVRPGDRIPLDGVVIEGDSRIDTSPVTGEPVPVHVGHGDSVTSGTINTSGQLKIRVEKVLEDSMVTRILDSVENAAANKPKIDRFITRFSRVYTPVVVCIALATAIIPSLITGDWNHWIYTAITFLVISCPCALVLSVPLAFFCGIGAASKLGILFKGGAAIDAITRAKAVVMDKTGTLTKGNFAVQQMHPVGVTDDALLKLAATCELNSTHPIAASIVEAAKAAGLKLTPPKQVKEYAGKGVVAETGEGTLACGNRRLMQAEHVALPEDLTPPVGTEVLVAKNGTYIGALTIADTIKADAADAVRKLKKRGLRTAMLTGDAKANADAVAKATGIDEVHAGLLPEQKLTELEAIRHKDGPVIFIGDGINDAPVLAGADVGAAMGSGADAAIDAADVVFMTSDAEAIVDAIDIGRMTSKIAWQNVVIALSVKAVILVMGLLGYANMWLAVFADTGVAMLCILNSVRILGMGKRYVSNQIDTKKTA